MSRYRAFAIHFGISFVIFLMLTWLVVYVWYPGFFFETDGGWEGMRIIVAVDLVLGPLLTVIVFKAGKPGLGFDLTLIGLMQVAALGAGVYIVYSERPLAMVYVDGQFFSVSRKDFTEVGLALPDLDGLPGPSPKWVEVEIPDDPFEQSRIRAEGLRKNIPLRLLVERYQPFVPGPNFANEAYGLIELEERDWEHRAIPAWLAAHGGELSDYAFYPYGARYRYTFIGYHKGHKDPAGLLDLDAPYASDETNAAG
jgi:hypothetical protein